MMVGKFRKRAEWQIGILETANLICFFNKKQIKFAVSKKSIPSTVYLILRLFREQ